MSEMAAEQSPVKVMAAAEFDGGELWTEEKHVSFLNRMEACFVRRLVESAGRGRGRLARRRPRLDRFLPDISESTHDLRFRGSMGAGKAPRGVRRCGKADRRPSTAAGDGDSGDQVVPELVIRGPEEQLKNG